MVWLFSTSEIKWLENEIHDFGITSLACRLIRFIADDLKLGSVMGLPTCLCSWLITAWVVVFSKSLKTSKERNKRDDIFTTQFHVVTSLDPIDECTAVEGNVRTWVAMNIFQFILEAVQNRNSARYSELPNPPYRTHITNSWEMKDERVLKWHPFSWRNHFSESQIPFLRFRRNCFFEGEKKLRFFKQYTKYNCEQECLR